MRTCLARLQDVTDVHWLQVMALNKDLWQLTPDY